MSNVQWVGLLSLVILGAPRGRGGPALGTRALDASAKDVDGGPFELKALSGKPILVLYEDKDSTQLNAGLKEELSRLVRLASEDRSWFAIVPVADVSGYDYWPVKGFVGDAIRSESLKLGVPIYCDWDGAFRDSLSLQRGTSNVVLIGKSGRVVFTAQGALSDAERRTLLRILREEAGDAGDESRPG